MKKLIILLFIILPLKNFAIDFFKGSYAEALEKCKKENKFLFLDFTAVWCGPCHTMEKEVLNDIEVSKYIDEKFVVLKLDIDEPKVYYYREKYVKNNGIPDYTILNSSGEQIGKHHGSCTKVELLNFFKNLGTDKALTAGQIEEYINSRKIAYENKPSASNLYYYIASLTKSKNDANQGFEIYKADIERKGFLKADNLQPIMLLASAFAKNNDENGFGNLLDFLKGYEVKNIKSKMALAAYEFHISQNQVLKAKESLTVYLNIIDHDITWLSVASRIDRIKVFAYTYHQYAWGIEALEKLRLDYAMAYRNKSRLPISGHYYQLAMMSFLNKDCAQTKKNLIQYRKYPNGYTHVSSYSIENSTWIEKMDNCGNASK